MTSLVFDIEADGLYYDAEQVWCISLKDVERPESPLESFSCRPIKDTNGTLQSGLQRLSEASTLIGHNILNYDIPLLKKLYNWEPNEDTEIIDTMVMSYLFNSDRTRPVNYTGSGGPHSLECWGYRVGKSKPDHTEWNVFSPAMLRRNREDVEINHLVYNTLRSEELAWDWSKALQLEHSIAALITKQEHHGVHFDVGKAERYVAFLESKIQEIDEEWVPQIPGTPKQRGTTILEPFTATGAHSKRYREDISYCSGPFTRIDFVPINLGSADQVKRFLLDNGWRPEEWNYNKLSGERASPKLKGAFEGVEGELATKVKERFTLRHRKSQIEGWISNIRSDGRIGAGAFTNGTNTGRMRHTVVVNVPKANSDKETGELIWDTDKQKDFFGTQMRSLFCVKPGSDYVMVGHDAAGLELRMLAHYMKDDEYIRQILHGDIHSYNQQAAGLDTRDLAKSFIYAFLYGAGDEKLGAVTGKSATAVRKVRGDFLKSLPSLEKLLRSVKRAAAKGFLRGLDGRKVWMRRDANGQVMIHKALNTLLQHSGSILMKKSSDILWNELLPGTGIRAYKVIDMHDESQAEVHKDDIEQYKELAVRSIVLAGEYFNLRIPMDADAKVGYNWAETH